MRGARLTFRTEDEARRRARLVAGGLAGATAVLLAVFAIATASGAAVEDHIVEFTASDGSQVTTIRSGYLVPYIAQPGLRAGATAGVALLVLPFLTFVVMALRTGAASRERRLAALSLAGATGRQLRRLAAAEGARIGAVGVALALPMYLLLWLLVGVLPQPGKKLLPQPTPLLALGYLLVAGLIIGFAMLAAIRASDVARVGPLGVTRRVRRPLGPRDAVLPVISGLLVWAPVNWGDRLSRTVTDYLVFVVMLAMVVFSVSVGRWLAFAAGRLSVRGGIVGTLAGRRLLADVRTPGRVAGVLLAAGVTIGVAGAFTSGFVASWSVSMAGSRTFYLVPAAAAVAGAVLTAAVACGALVVGAVEQVLDGRRGIAVLVSLAASPTLVGRVVRRQLVLASVPPIVLGAAIGSLTYSSFAQEGAPWWLLSLPLSAVIGWAGAVLAARAVRPAILVAAEPSNLRAA